MSKSLQQRLLDAVVQHFPKRVAAIEALSNLLGVGRDGIYRRMRGDTILSPKEVEVIALTFHVSLDDLIFGQSDTVIFSFNGFDESTRSFIDYLERFESELSRASSMGDGHFYYASVELPLFQSCFFKELICFKLYIWGLTVLGYEALQDRPFSFELLPVPLLATIQRIQELYVNVPSTELWGRNVVDNTLNQIEYHFSSGHFRSPDDALLLCEKLTELTFHMQSMASVGKKFLPDQKPDQVNNARFSLYYNEMIYTSNTILAVLPKRKMLFTSLSNPHFLKSDDERLCDYMEEWFRNVTSKSSALSLQSERQRQGFFNHLRKRIEITQRRIEVLQEH